MGGEVGSASGGCPRRIFNARWETTPVKCGDDARMQADTENIPADTDATFVVKKVSDNSTITTVNNTTHASSVSGTWVSQKPSDGWNGAEVKFTVSGGGESADSERDQLSFHRYADIGRTDFTQRRTSGRFGWDQAVKVELDDRVLVIHVPIKIRKCGKLPKRRKNEEYGPYVRRWRPDRYQSPRDDLSAADKTNLKNAIEGMFRRKVALHRHSCQRHSSGCPDPISRKCCKFEIKVLIHFYNMNDASAPAIASVVNYWNDSGRANSSNWFAADYPGSNWVFTHEVGHLLGFYDEYTGGACNPSHGTSWQCVAGFSTGTLMNGGERIREYYFNDYAAWIGDAGRTNERWAVIRYA